MFVGIEMDPESGSINNDGSVFVEPTLKKAVNHMKKHLKGVVEDRFSLSGVNAYIVDTELCLVVVGLTDYGNYVQLEATVGDFEVSNDYFQGIKIDKKATIDTCDIPVFKKFTSW